MHRSLSIPFLSSNSTHRDTGNTHQSPTPSGIPLSVCVLSLRRVFYERGEIFSHRCAWRAVPCNVRVRTDCKVLQHRGVSSREPSLLSPALCGLLQLRCCPSPLYWLLRLTVPLLFHIFRMQPPAVMLSVRGKRSSDTDVALLPRGFRTTLQC